MVEGTRERVWGVEISHSFLGRSVESRMVLTIRVGVFLEVCFIISQSVYGKSPLRMRSVSRRELVALMYIPMSYVRTNFVSEPVSEPHVSCTRAWGRE